MKVYKITGIKSGYMSSREGTHLIRAKNKEEAKEKFMKKFGGDYTHIMEVVYVREE